MATTTSNTPTIFELMYDYVLVQYDAKDEKQTVKTAYDALIMSANKRHNSKILYEK